MFRMVEPFSFFGFWDRESFQIKAEFIIHSIDGESDEGK